MYRIYDVFISYNSEDKIEAIELNHLLEEYFELSTWFDMDKISSGMSILDSIDEGMSKSLSCIILVGKNGEGPWQKKEIKAALLKQIEQENFKVIPVLLPGCKSKPNLPSFLMDIKWIDLRENLFENLRNLFFTIKGESGAPIYTSIKEANNNKIFKNHKLPSGYSADASKIVELLIGESLYSQKFICIREIIQNSVDALERRKFITRGAFNPQIIVRINSSECWFEIDDNGEGMDPKLLRESFAKVGKSIKDEKSILRRVTAKKPEERLYLIAKFGIGFISTFIISRKVTISTKYKSSNQINLTIDDITKRFSYSDISECGRDAKKIGTTIRVYVMDEYRDIDVVDTIRKYVRHIPYCEVIKDEETIDIRESWNSESAIFQERFEEKYSYDFNVGVSEDSGGSILASNWGFLISETPYEIIPYFTPKWIVGEIDLYPGVVDLNLSRDKIINNEKSFKIKGKIRNNLREFIREIEVKVRTTKDKVSSMTLKKKLIDLMFIYNYCSRKNKENQMCYIEEPIVSLEESTNLILDLFEVSYGSNKVSLREALDKLRKTNKSTIYYYWQIQHHSELYHLSNYLSKEGFIVFEYFSKRISFYGENDSTIEISEVNVLEPILEENGFMLKDFSDISFESIKGISANLKEIPNSFINIIKTVNDYTKIYLVKLKNADLSFKRGDKWYLNILNPSFSQLLKWASSSKENEGKVLLYLLGLFQSNILKKQAR